MTPKEKLERIKHHLAVIRKHSSDGVASGEAQEAIWLLDSMEATDGWSDPDANDFVDDEVHDDDWIEKDVPALLLTNRDET